MTKLYQNDFLYDKSILLGKDHSLRTLMRRSDTCYDITFEA
jgi:hypothetical protein